MQGATMPTLWWPAIDRYIDEGRLAEAQILEDILNGG
jgi:hypothetical protein